MITKPGFVTTPNTTYDASQWDITSTVILTSGVIWKGGTFTGTGAAFASNGNCTGAWISGVTLASSVDYLLEGNVQPFVTYDGTDAKFLYKNLVVDGVTLSGKTILYNGTFEGPKTYHNVCFGLTINNVTKSYDTTSGNLLVVGHSIYKFRANNWTLKGDTQIGLVDNGVVQLNSGNGQLSNVYRNGKQDGYIMRCWGTKIGSDPDQDVIVENCVDANTVVYGTMDFRVDTSLLQSKAAIPLTGCNCTFANNTSANKQDIYNGYVTSACVIGATVDDLGNKFTVTIKNNIAFGAHVSAMANNSSLLKDNSSGNATIILQNNIDIPPGQLAPPLTVDNNYYGLKGMGAQSTTVTPPVIKQRSVVYPTFDGKTWHFVFDDGSTQ